MKGAEHLWEKLRHAFAVGTVESEPLTLRQKELVERICRTITQRQLTPAAVALLELTRPLSYLGAQGLHFFEPIATGIFSREEYQEFARLLERRDAIDIIADRLEERESGKVAANSLLSEQSAAPAQNQATAEKTFSPRYDADV